MKRYAMRWISLLLCLLFVAGISACGKTEESDDTKTQTSDAAREVRPPAQTTQAQSDADTTSAETAAVRRPVSKPSVFTTAQQTPAPAGDGEQPVLPKPEPLPTPEPEPFSTKDNENFLSLGACTTADGKQAENGAMTGRQGSYLDLVFPEPVAFNTIVLNEKEPRKNVTVIRGFEIQVENSGRMETIYRQDLAGTLRYCTFPMVTASHIRVVFTEATGTFTLNGMQILRIRNQKNDQFRVTTYVTKETGYHVGNLDPAHFDVVTDVIIFGMLRFNENGTVYIPAEMDVDWSGNMVNGTEAFERELENVRAAVKGRDVAIHVNIMGPDKDASSKINPGYCKAMTEHQQDLVRNINQFLLKYRLDGIFFDWEYPSIEFGYTQDWSAFNSFIPALKAGVGKKTVGVAMAAWNDRSTKAFREAVDQVELMAYDDFDENGYHSTFYRCGPSMLNTYLRKGWSPAKLDLGVPFYGKRVDGTGVDWGYSGDAARLGRFGNDVTDPDGVKRYYNGYQMVYDKTAYAYDTGIGGVMSWHFGCDTRFENNLSLFRATRSAIADRV